jgi:hypothetical protein
VAVPSAEKNALLHVHRRAPTALALLPGHAEHEDEPAAAEKVLAPHTARTHATPRHAISCHDVARVACATTYWCTCRRCIGCPQRTTSSLQGECVSDPASL